MSVARIKEEIMCMVETCGCDKHAPTHEALNYMAMQLLKNESYLAHNNYNCRLHTRHNIS